MNALLRRRLEMAGRVRDFLRAHKTDAVGEGLGLAKLEELIARAEALDAQQRAGIVTTRLCTKHREGLRRALQSKLLQYLRALGGLEKTIESTRAGRRDHVGASADLQTVAAEIKKQVRALDGMVRYRFGDNAELMGAWRSARNVLGPFKAKSEPEAGGSQPKAA